MGPAWVCLPVDETLRLWSCQRGPSSLVTSLPSRIPAVGSTLASVMVVREETYDGGETRFGADWLNLCLFWVRWPTWTRA